MGPYRSAKGLLNNSKILECQSHLTNSMNHHKQGACPKRPVQQGRRTPGLRSQRPLRQNRLGARSVYGVREDDKDPRTPLADFFNRPVKYLGWLLCFGAVGFPLLAPIPARSGHVQSALDEWHILRQNLDGRGITLETTNTTDIGSAVNWKGDPRLWL